MHSIRRATLPPNFAEPEETARLLRRTCNVFSRVRRENRPEISGYRRDKGVPDSPSVDIPENPVKIGSSYRIGLRNVEERKILREYQNFNLEFHFIKVRNASRHKTAFTRFKSEEFFFFKGSFNRRRRKFSFTATSAETRFEDLIHDAQV